MKFPKRPIIIERVIEKNHYKTDLQNRVLFIMHFLGLTSISTLLINIPKEFYYFTINIDAYYIKPFSVEIISFIIFFVITLLIYMGSYYVSLKLFKLFKVSTNSYWVITILIGSSLLVGGIIFFLNKIIEAILGQQFLNTYTLLAFLATCISYSSFYIVDVYIAVDNKRNFKKTKIGLIMLCLFFILCLPVFSFITTKNNKSFDILLTQKEEIFVTFEEENNERTKLRFYKAVLNSENDLTIFTNRKILKDIENIYLDTIEVNEVSFELETEQKRKISKKGYNK